MKDNELLYRLGQRLKELRKAKKWSLRILITASFQNMNSVL